MKHPNPYTPNNKSPKSEIPPHPIFGELLAQKGFTLVEFTQTVYPQGNRHLRHDRKTTLVYLCVSDGNKYVAETSYFDDSLPTQYTSTGVCALPGTLRFKSMDVLIRGIVDYPNIAFL